MNAKDLDFMKTFFLGLENNGVDLTTKTMFYNHIFRNSITSFYGYSKSKTITEKMKHLIDEEMFEFQGLDLILTNKAKKQFRPRVVLKEE